MKPTLKQVALGYQANNMVLFIYHRQMTDTSHAHNVLGDAERIANL
jgi:hypothetical protein